MSKKRFNIIDALIVLVILCVAVFGTYFVKQFTTKEIEDTKTIVFEVTKVKESLSDYIVEGDVVYDGTQNTELGKIVSFEAMPAATTGTDIKTGKLIKTTVPNKYDYLITIEADKNKELQVGKHLWIETGHFKAEGYVVEIEDGEEN